MKARRKMVKGLGAVLIIAVALAFLAGVVERATWKWDVFVYEAPTAWWRIVGVLRQMVAGLRAALVPTVAVATLYLLVQQERWAARQTRVMLWEKRYPAMEAVRRFLVRVVGECKRLEAGEARSLQYETMGRSFLFEERARQWLVGLSLKAAELENKDVQLRRDKEEVGNGFFKLEKEDRERIVRERRELYRWFEGKAAELEGFMQEYLEVGEL